MADPTEVNTQVTDVVAEPNGKNKKAQKSRKSKPTKKAKKTGKKK
jgi:hypothetical protein